ncbi:MAG TPA: hypothetical protein DD740_03305 [Chryseobacterium sp.]|nr:hypothetical protein [Chryseobacterium sp.]
MGTIQVWKVVGNGLSYQNLREPPDPVIANPHQFNTKVMGMSKSGIYKFLWTITTGNCTSSDEMEINDLRIMKSARNQLMERLFHGHTIPLAAHMQ